MDIRSSMDMVKQKFIQTQLSKIIVYDENIDNILGYIHQLDLFRKSTDISSLLPIPAVPGEVHERHLFNF